MIFVSSLRAIEPASKDVYTGDTTLAIRLCVTNLRNPFTFLHKDPAEVTPTTKLKSRFFTAELQFCRPGVVSGGFRR